PRPSPPSPMSGAAICGCCSAAPRARRGGRWPTDASPCRAAGTGFTWWEPTSRPRAAGCARAGSSSATASSPAPAARRSCSWIPPAIWSSCFSPRGEADRTGAVEPEPTRQDSALLLVLVDGGEAGDPGQRRAEPVLLLRHELRALAQDADPQHVGG